MTIEQRVIYADDWARDALVPEEESADYPVDDIHMTLMRREITTAREFDYVLVFNMSDAPITDHQVRELEAGMGDEEDGVYYMLTPLWSETANQGHISRMVYWEGSGGGRSYTGLKGLTWFHIDAGRINENEDALRGAPVDGETYIRHFVRAILMGMPREEINRRWSLVRWPLKTPARR